MEVSMLSLLFKNLKHLIVKDRLVFILFLVGQLLCIMSVMYEYTFLRSSNTHMSTDSSHKTISVSIDGEYTAEQVKNKINSIVDERDNISQLFFVNGDLHIDCMYPGTKIIVSAGKYFSKESFNAGAKEIILSTGFATLDEHVGVGHTLDGEEYTIVGLTAGSYNIVPLNSYARVDELNDLNILLEAPPDDKEISSWSAYLAKLFPGCAVTPPERVNASVSQDALPIVGIIIFIAALNIAFIYRYILQRRKKQYAIFRLSGCSKAGMAFLSYAEVFIWAAAVFMLSAAFYMVIDSVIAKYWFEDYFNFELDLRGALNLFLIYIVITLLVYIPTISAFCKKNPLEMRRY